MHYKPDESNDEGPERPAGGVPEFSEAHRQILVDFGERHADDGTLSWPETAGFLFAVQACPDLVMPSEWLEVIQGEAVFSDLDEAQAVTDARMALMNWISDRVRLEQLAIPTDCAPDPEPLRILESDNDFSRWCRGLIAGHDWVRQSWDEVLEIDSDDDRAQGMALILFTFFTGRTMAEHVVEEFSRNSASNNPTLEEQANKFHALIGQAALEYAAISLDYRQMPSAPTPRQPARSDKIGRNQPCPCGSGKKYKKCCLPNDRQTRERRPDPVQPEPDFQGLSPAQMHQLLYHPFESPELVQFRESLATEPEAPVLGLFRYLAEGLGEKGLKATAKGNLPREFCRQAACQAATICREIKWLEPERLRSETDYMDLHVTRLVCELAGLVRKYKSRFVLTKKARGMLRKTGLREIHPLLLRTYATRFNWAYRDRAEELPIVQHSFAYTLYLLDRHGRQWQPHQLYEDSFVQAFSAALTEVPDREVYPAERAVRNCYRWRTLQHFLEFFGVIEMQALSDDLLDPEYRIRARPLFGEAVRFTVDTGAHRQGRVH